MLTQKYKQQQQQVRVQTSESNYAKGMFFSDVPLTEGYAKLLVNWKIDTETGKLVPRKGTHSTGIGRLNPFTFPKEFEFRGFNYITQTKTTAPYVVASPTQRSTIAESQVLAILYNTFSKDMALLSIPQKELGYPTAQFPNLPYTLLTDPGVPMHHVRPHKVFNPKVHGQTAKADLFETPVGCFAFNSNYYTFLASYPHKAELIKLARIPSSKYPQIPRAQNIGQYYPIGVPGTYFTGDSAGNAYEEFDQPDQKQDTVYYYDYEGNLKKYFNNKFQSEGYASNEASFLASAYANISTFKNEGLFYTKLGQDILPDDVLATNVSREKIGPTQQYLCKIVPQKLNPSEAASWGYNMLLDEPYHFECEKTATNTITILGILPYDNSGEVCLTPRKNQEITLKAYYRAPEAFHSNIKNGAFYATTKHWFGESEDPTEDKNKRNPAKLDELPTDLTNYKFGDWWYVEDTKEYYMVMPGEDLTKKRLALFGTSKPAASVQLTPTVDKTAENKVRVHWQIRTVNSSSWVDVYNNEVTLTSEQEPFTVTTTMSSDEVLVKLTISDPLDVDDLGQEYILTTNTIGLSLVSDDLANTLNLTPKKYDLGTCTGMCEWEQRLVLWGVYGAPNTIFVSDVNNPTFFPYPNNVDTLPEPVLHVFNYGAELLAVTATALYRLTWNTDGLGWTHTLVQRNLKITEADIPLCCVIKNMFFFKSGEYYYMMVPKATSVQGESTIAPISKPIEGLLDNFQEEITNLISTLCDNTITNNMELINYYTSVNNSEVIVNYVYNISGVALNTVNGESLEKSAYLTVQLIYNTDARTWSMELLETAHVPTAITVDTTQNKRYLQVIHAKDIGNWDADASTLAISLTGYRGDPLVTDYYTPTPEDLSDKDIQYINLEAPESNYYYDPIWHEYKLQNYQFLDTGNRDINTDMKKRFREFQFKIRNVNATSLGMKTSFMIDGALRRDLQKFSPRYITDESTGEAVIVIERTLDNNPDYLSFVPEYKITRVERVIASTKMVQDAGELTPTTLAESTDPDYWVIDQSAFPGRTFWKVRVAISGKGYTPRAQLLSTNLKHFEVLGHNWVYRTMHGR